MYRDYDEERDDELYHYGRQGMKWGQHVYAMAKNVASRAARSASKNLKTGTKFLKDNPQFAYGVLAYAGSRAIQSRSRKKNLEAVRNTFGKVDGAYD